MKKGLTVKDITPGMKSSVKAYLLSRAYAETMRDAVDKIERKILEECPLTNDLEIKHGKPAREITEPKDVYLCDNDDLLQDYYDTVDFHLDPDDEVNALGQSLHTRVSFGGPFDREWAYQRVQPGRYTIKLIVGDETLTGSVQILQDHWYDN